MAKFKAHYHFRRNYRERFDDNLINAYIRPILIARYYKTSHSLPTRVSNAWEYFSECILTDVSAHEHFSRPWWYRFRCVYFAFLYLRRNIIITNAACLLKEKCEADNRILCMYAVDSIIGVRHHHLLLFRAYLAVRYILSINVAWKAIRLALHRERDDILSRNAYATSLAIKR